MTQNIDPRLLVAVCIGLFFFGLFYDNLLARWGKNYAGLLVAGFVLVSLGGLALLSWTAALMALGALLPGGLYLLIRDLQRTIQAHEDERRFQRIELEAERAAARQAATEELDGYPG